MRRLVIALAALAALPCASSPLIVATLTNNVSMSGACVGASPCAATVLTDSLLNQWSVNAGVVYLAPGGANNAATPSNSVILLLYYQGVIYQENSSANWWYWSSGWVATTGDPRGSSGPTSSAGVAVSGANFINSATNSTVVLAGSNISGMEGHQGSWTVLAQITAAQWSSIAAKWGINMIRLPLNSAYWLNHTVYDDPAQPGGGSCCYTSIGGNAYTPDPTGTYQSALQTIVSNITAAGIVVSLDLHWDAPKNSSGNAIAPIGQPSYAGGDYAPTFWTQVATAFKNNPLVMFELFNEPFGSNVYTNWVTGTATPGPDAITMVNGGTFANFLMQQNSNSNAIFTLQGCNPCNVAGMKGLITTIRATGAHNVIIGSPIGYAGELETWLASYTGSGNPDPLGQFGAAWHVYGYSKGVGYPNAVLAANYPIAITETYGFDNVFDGGKNANGYVWAAANNVAVDVWAWATWASGGATTGTALTNYMLGTAPWALHPATTPTGNTFGTSILQGPPVPAAAAAVGYNLLTFNTTKLGSTTGTWQPMTLEGCNTSTSAYSQNSNGSIYLSGAGNSCSGANISTVTRSSNAVSWSGITFGGGAYFEATMSFTGQGNGPYANGGPAFWAEDIEHMSQGPYANIIGWPSTANAWNSGTSYALNAMVSYQNQVWLSSVANNLGNAPPTGNTAFGNTYWRQYNNFFEVDFMEYDCSQYVYQNGIGNWWGNSGGPSINGPSGSTSNTVAFGCAGGVQVPNTTDFSQPHKYGCLWVPATATTQGYLKFYFDGTQTGNTFYWNYYNINSPSTYPAPPPVNGSTAMSGMDWKHMLLMLGTGTNQPTTVYGVVVYQASAANNLQY